MEGWLAPGPPNQVSAWVSRGQSTSGASRAPSSCTMVVMSSQSSGQNGQVQSRMPDGDAAADRDDEGATDAPGVPALDGGEDERCMEPLVQSPCRFLKQGADSLHRQPVSMHMRRASRRSRDG